MARPGWRVSVTGGATGSRPWNGYFNTFHKNGALSSSPRTPAFAGATITRCEDRLHFSPG